jgi:hypothetical protein
MRNRRHKVRGLLAAVAAASALASIAALQANASAGTTDTGPTTGTLPASKTILPSAVKVDLQNQYVRLPLHKGEYNGQTVWYVLTEASDQGAADDLGLNYAPKLGNMSIGCDACVQNVTLSGTQGNVFGEGIVHFAGIPDFSPTRVLKAGPTDFPPSQATPGAVGGDKYSPFIRIAGSQTTEPPSTCCSCGASTPASRFCTSPPIQATRRPRCSSAPRT